MSKATVSKIIGIVLTAVIAIAAIFGYSILIDQPRENSMWGFATGGGGQAADSSRTVRDTVIHGGLTVSGIVSASAFVPTSYAASGAFYANTANITTTLSVASTPVARLSGSALDETSIKVGATPVALVSGSSLDETSVKVAGTPVVVQVGALAGGNALVCGSATFTGTGVLPTGLSTPSYVNLTLAQDTTYDCNRLSYTNAAATVTAKCWNGAATPAAAAAAAVVNWCAVGKP